MNLRDPQYKYRLQEGREGGGAGQPFVAALSPDTRAKSWLAGKFRLRGKFGHILISRSTFLISHALNSVDWNVRCSNGFAM